MRQSCHPHFINNMTQVQIGSDMPRISENWVMERFTPPLLPLVQGSSLEELLYSWGSCQALEVQ